jgi:hypothetical protein
MSPARPSLASAPVHSVLPAAAQGRAKPGMANRPG